MPARSEPDSTTGREPAVSWREATPADAVALRDLERVANVAGLAQVFAGLPFPDEGVLARWRATLVEPGVRVLMTEVAFVCWDAEGRLRYLAVHPDHWGAGLAREAMGHAVAAIRAAGQLPTLWVLAANDRARRLYTHLGWEPTGRERAAEWPPYPTEQQLCLRESAHGR